MKCEVGCDRVAGAIALAVKSVDWLLVRDIRVYVVIDCSSATSCHTPRSRRVVVASGSCCCRPHRAMGRTAAVHPSVRVTSSSFRVNRSFPPPDLSLIHI